MEKGGAEVQALKDICEEAKQEGKLTDEHLSRLTAVFGSRFTKAWKAVENDRVKKYTFEPSGRVVWIVVGRGRDYLVMPAAGFCSCDDFFYNVMEKKTYQCYHLIAQKLAESLGRYDTISEGDDFYDVLMKDWRKATS